MAFSTREADRGRAAAEIKQGKFPLLQHAPERAVGFDDLQRPLDFGPDAGRLDFKLELVP